MFHANIPVRCLENFRNYWTKWTTSAEWDFIWAKADVVYLKIDADISEL